MVVANQPTVSSVSMGRGATCSRSGARLPGSASPRTTAATAARAAVSAATSGAEPAPPRSRAQALASSASAKHHPGRYAATVGIRPTGPDDPLLQAQERTLASLGAVLHGYRLDPTEQIYALRMLRHVLHGFALLETSDGFQMSTDIDESFTWMGAFLDQGPGSGGTTETDSAAPFPTIRPQSRTAVASTSTSTSGSKR